MERKVSHTTQDALRQEASRIVNRLEGASVAGAPSHLLDAHCHLGLMENGVAVAAQAAAEGLGLFSMGVEPQDFPAEVQAFAVHGGIEVGLGLHPWYVEPDSWHEQVDGFAAHFPQAVIIGEVGLDFGAAHEQTADAQRAAFARILELVASGSGRCMSFHAVHAAGEVLDMLESSGAVQDNVAIFHWFSGTSDELNRAIAMGAFFSVGQRMLATRRGRSYARAIPANRLLLETDAPRNPGDACSAAALAVSLRETSQLIR